MHATGSFEPTSGDALTTRTLPLFFSILRLLLEGGVTVVAEAAFQETVWKPNLMPLTELAHVRIVQCHTDPDTARRRMSDRAGSRRAHADAEIIVNTRYFGDFRRVAMSAPSIDVDTTAGYEPSIERIVYFVNRV